MRDDVPFLADLSDDARITVMVFAPLVLLGVVVLLVVGAKLARIYLRSRGLARVAGTVVDHRVTVARMNSFTGPGSSNATLLRAVVQYTGPDGAAREVLHPIAASAPYPPLGAAVDVCFDPARPHEAEVSSPLARYLAPATVFFAVAVFTAILAGVGLSVISRG